MTVPPAAPEPTVPEPNTDGTVQSQQDAPDDAGLSRRVEAWADEVDRHLERLTPRPRRP